MYIVDIRDIMLDIETELNAARKKFPDNEHMMTALTEEVGELAQALLHINYEPGKKVTHEDVYKEAVQVAVMAIRVATEGDSTLPAYDSRSGHYGKSWPGYVTPNTGDDSEDDTHA